MGLGDRKLVQPEIVDEGVVLIPFGFTIDGTSDPTALKGDLLLTAVRAEAGEFLCTLAAGNAPYFCFFGLASVSNTADDVDMYTIVDWSTVASARTFTVRCMTAATQTDPTTAMLVGGFLLCKKTDRVAGR